MMCADLLTINLYLRPLTHAPETITINLMPDSGASFSCRCTISDVIDCLCMLEVVHWHEILAPESGVEVMAPISRAGFWSVCHGLSCRFVASVGSGLRRDSPLLLSLHDGLVICDRTGLVTCLHACAALACLASGF